jgi:glycosyltransferase involved in cell wall biosynthesis
VRTITNETLKMQTTRSARMADTSGPDAAPEKLRVTYLVRALDVGGAEIQLSALVRGLDPNRVEAHVVCFYQGGALEAELYEAGVPLHFLNKKGRWDLAGFASRLRATLAATRPHIVHAYMGPANIAAIICRPFLNDTRVLQGVRASDMDFRNYDWSWRATFRLEALLSRFADLIIANSEAGRRFCIERSFCSERFRVVPNGIDTDRFKPDTVAGAALRDDWGIPRGVPLIGLVARLDPMKDHETFIEAAARLAALEPEVRFICIGAGAQADFDRLGDLAKARGLADRLFFSGRRDDLPAVYATLDVHTSSSAYGEGFSNALGEAMACAIPCVATDVGDSALIVDDTGRVVRCRDAAALANAWHELLALPLSARRNLGSRARTRIVESYSLPTMIAATEAAYRQLLSPTS